MRVRRRALQACEIGGMCVVAACARGRVRGACAHLRHSISTSSSVEQRKEEVDPAGLEVRGEGDGPHPANRCARPHAGHVRVGAPSLGPASARNGRQAQLGGRPSNGISNVTTMASARQRTPPGRAPASRKLIHIDLLSSRTAAVCSCAHARLLSTTCQRRKGA